MPVAERSARAQLISLANGYFSTLEHNNGEIRGTRFLPDASRFENGKQFAEIEKWVQIRDIRVQQPRS